MIREVWFMALGFTLGTVFSASFILWPLRKRSDEIDVEVGDNIVNVLGTAVTEEQAERIRQVFRGDDSEPPLMPGPPLNPNPKGGRS
jgi:hypothetical protein